jgi:hypothetical protein
MSVGAKSTGQSVGSMKQRAWSWLVVTFELSAASALRPSY